MGILTRSQKKTRPETESDHESENDDSKKVKSIKIELIPPMGFKKKKTRDESTSESSSSFEDEFIDFLPEKVVNNSKYMKTIHKLIKSIESETPTLEKLLESKMRKKHKADMFEWILILENLPPLSEEKKILRKQVHNMFQTYTKEYDKYKVYKSEIHAFEEKNKDYNELFDIQYKILNLNTDEGNKDAIYRKYMELTQKVDEIDEEFYKIKNWIQVSLQLPFDSIKKFPEFLNISDYLIYIKNIFDKELYGMQRVKEQMLLFIHSKLLNPDLKGCCLGLIGDPGVGKTSIARCLAKVMDFPFEQITFGGINSADYIKGFDYTYVGSRPGEIVRCLTRMKFKNGIIFFDEYEKISQNKDITSCLLHITDFTQNNSYRDNYLCDLKIDLSSIWFIYSMNQLPEDEALKDRIFVIKVDGYKEFEKVRILCDYLLPKHLKNLNLATDSIKINDDVGKYIVRKICSDEGGIRTLEKALKDVLGKTCFLVTNQQKIQCTFMLPNKYYPFNYPISLNEEIIDVFLKNNSFQNSMHHLNIYS